MECYFEINLRRMAILSHALSLLEANGVPGKLKDFHFQNKNRCRRIKFCNKLADEVVESIDPESLPTNLYYELTVVVKDVARKLNEWYNYVANEIIFQDQTKEQIQILTEDIYWTHYGTIDGFKILKYSWLKIPNVDLSKIYVMACSYCSEELIHGLWVKINFTISYEELCKREDFYLVAYWNKFRENRLEDFKNDCIVPVIGHHRPIKVYDSNESVEANMIRLSARKGCFNAVKYFWNKLSEKEKDECVGDSFMLALKSYYYEDVELYKQDEYADIIFFLFKFLHKELMEQIFLKRKMSDDPQKYQCLKAIFTVCIRSWPWLNFLLPVFNYLEYLLNAEVYQSLLSKLSSKMLGQNSLSVGMLDRVWSKIPNSLKISAVNEDYLSALFKNWNMLGMRLILNDLNMAEKRDDFIKNLNFNFVSILRENEFEKLYRFVDEILIPVDLDQKIQEIIKSVYHLILKGDMNSVENLLYTVTAEEIIIIKEAINPYILCYYFVLKDEFHLADEFLNWRFCCMDEVEEFKAEFKDSHFSWSYIRNMWKLPEENLETAKETADKLLFWLLKDEENVTLFKQEFLNSFWQAWINKDNLYILNDFLQWCHLSEEEVEDFKNSSFKSKLPRILKHLILESRFEEFDKICDWTFNSDNDKIDYMQEFLFSDEGVTAFWMYIPKLSYHRDDEPRPEKEFIILKLNDLIQFLSKSLTNSDGSFKEKLRDWIKMFESQLSAAALELGNLVEAEKYEFWTEDHKLFARLVYEVANDSNQ